MQAESSNIGVLGFGASYIRYFMVVDVTLESGRTCRVSPWCHHYAAPGSETQYISTVRFEETHFPRSAKLHVSEQHIAATKYVRDNRYLHRYYLLIW